jgi:ribosomal subunit interface protein
MQTPLELSFNNLDPSPAAETKIRERVARLDRLFPNIVSCHVAVDSDHRSEGRGRSKAVAYDVRIEVRVPGTELAVSRKPGNRHAHTDIYVAVRDSFDAMERQLKSYADRLHRDVKTHSEPLQGKVARLFRDEGYGFIATTDGREVYFHCNSVIEEGFFGLDIGSPVQLSVIDGESAEGTQATTVRMIRPQQLRQQPQ